MGHLQHPAKRVTLVIGSGGIKCAASIGLWRVLNREGIGIDRVIGASGGSLYAAMMALDFGVDDAARLTQEVWTSDLVDGYASGLKAALSGEAAFTERSGLTDDSVLNRRMRTVFGDATFAHTRIPLSVVATDVYSGESVTITEGLIFDALRASIAIPLIWPPWPVGGRLLTDAAVSDPLPLDAAIRENAGVILAMGFDLPLRARARSYNAVVSHFNALYMNNLLKAAFAFQSLASHAEVIMLMPEFDRPLNAFDGSQVPYIAGCGERAAEEQLGYLKQLLGGV